MDLSGSQSESQIIVLSSPMIPLAFSKPRRLIRFTTQDDFDAIKTSLARKEEEMTRLDTEIAKLSHRLAPLTKERNLIMAAYPPIHKLSADVLQEIFIFCLPPWKYAVLTAREAPLLLCRVCHSWRELAHATPQLWSSVHFPLNDRKAHPAPSLDDIKSWLSRSKSLPLSISIMQLPNPYGFLLEPYMDVVASVKNRWKSLHILSRTTFDTVKFLMDMGNMDELCFLEELYIKSKYRGEHDDKPYSPFEFLLKIPKLRSLTIPFDVFLPILPNVDGTKLTRLGIIIPFRGTYAISDVFGILSCVPRLQILSISGVRSRNSFGEWRPETRQVHLAELETFSIIDYKGPFPVWEFLKALHTPRLRHWKFHLSACRYGRSILDPVSIFLSRLEQPLEELDLLLDSRGVEFRAFLGLVPNLKRLSLAKFIETDFDIDFDAEGRARGVGNFYLSCLTEGPTHSAGSSTPYSSPSVDWANDPSWDTTLAYPCPQLEVIKFVSYGEHVSDEALLHFLRQRTGSGATSNGVTSLKKVAIVVETKISDELPEAVQDILDGTGTQFHMRSLAELRH